MPSDRAPGGLILPQGLMLPRAFLCSVCGERVQELSYGQGFANCGMVKATTERWLCSACLREVVDHLDLRRREHMKEASRGDR